MKMAPNLQKPFAGHKDPEMNGTSTVEETKETGSKGLQPAACPNNAVGCQDISFILQIPLCSTMFHSFSLDFIHVHSISNCTP